MYAWTHRLAGARFAICTVGGIGIAFVAAISYHKAVPARKAHYWGPMRPVA